MEEDLKCRGSLGRVFNDRISVRSQRSAVIVIPASQQNGMGPWNLRAFAIYIHS